MSNHKNVQNYEVACLSELFFDYSLSGIPISMEELR